MLGNDQLSEKYVIIHQPRPYYTRATKFVQMDHCYKCLVSN